MARGRVSFVTEFNGSWMNIVINEVSNLSLKKITDHARIQDPF